jgi:hypothetical protein
MHFKEVNQLLEPGYLPLETGYYQLPNKHMHVAVLSQMPGCMGNMIDWWFGFALDNKTHRLLHPKSHLSIQWDGQHRPGQYIGARYVIKLNMGGRINKFRIHFHDPAEFLDTAMFEKGKVKAAIYMNVYDFEKIAAGRVIIIVRDTYFGCEIRTRFWLFNSSEEECSELMQYYIENMGHLSRFLPELYARDGAVQ